MDFQRQYWLNAPGKLIAFSTDCNELAKKYTYFGIEKFRIQISLPHSVPFHDTTLKHKFLPTKPMYHYVH